MICNALEKQLDEGSVRIATIITRYKKAQPSGHSPSGRLHRTPSYCLVRICAIWRKLDPFFILYVPGCSILS